MKGSVPGSDVWKQKLQAEEDHGEWEEEVMDQAPAAASVSCVTFSSPGPPY